MMSGWIAADALDRDVGASSPRMAYAQAICE
jgi:hypothetical protein